MHLQQKTHSNRQGSTSSQTAKWPLVSIVIPSYNGMKYLPKYLQSIVDLDYPNFEILIIDDESKDETVEYIQKHFPKIKIIKHKKNRGFSHTVNEGFWESKGEYVFLVNQDTVHSPDYLRLCIEKMQSNRDIAAIAGKVYKYDFDKGKKTNIFDSVGLIILKNRRVLDEGQGETDHGQFDKPREIFGVSGQNPIYRRQALMEVAIPIPGRKHKEIFDEDFFIYKEDVDLAWRLRLFGWKAWYLPKAVAWHGRGTSAVKRLTKNEIVGSRKKMNPFQRYHSIKNRYLMMLKNERPSTYLRHLPHIWWNDFLYFGYNLIFDTKNVTSYFTAITKVPCILKKRKWIMKHKQTTLTKEVFK